MATQSQRKATRNHRKRAASRGLVRVEVQTPRGDVALIRAVAQALRTDTARAKAVRNALGAALVDPEKCTALNAFASDLPDEVFEGVFDQPRDATWRDIDL